MRHFRRVSSLAFLLAGAAFGTALFLLRARFSTLQSPRRTGALLGLVAAMALAFWLGARAEAEVTRVDRQLNPPR